MNYLTEVFIQLSCKLDVVVVANAIMAPRLCDSAALALRLSGSAAAMRGKSPDLPKGRSDSTGL